MAEIRTPDVDDLLCVLAAIDDPDTIFALLEDLFTVREIRETEVLCGHRGGNGRLGPDHCTGLQMPQLRCRWL